MDSSKQAIKSNVFSPGQKGVEMLKGSWEDRKRKEGSAAGKKWQGEMKGKVGGEKSEGRGEGKRRGEIKE